MAEHAALHYNNVEVNLHKSCISESFHSGGNSEGPGT